MYFVFSQEGLDFIECCLVWLCHTKRRHEQPLVIRVDTIEDSTRVKSKGTIRKIHKELFSFSDFCILELT
jgi:hypothetical protein